MLARSTFSLNALATISLPILPKIIQARCVHVAITRFEGEEFLESILPPLRLFIFEASGNAPFRSLGHSLGWDIIEIIDANLFSIAPDAWTAAIVKSPQLRTRFCGAAKTIASGLALRWIDWAAKTPESITRRTSRIRHHCQRRVLCACGAGSRRGDAGGNRTWDHCRDSARFCARLRAVFAREKNADPRSLEMRRQAGAFKAVTCRRTPKESER